MGGVISHDEFAPIPAATIQEGSFESEQMCQQLVENGFSVLSLDEAQYEIIETQDKELKEIHADPKKETMGYADIEGTRDFIKLRTSGDRLGKFPESPANFKQAFTEAHELLAGIAWRVYLQLLSCHAIQPGPNALPADVISSLKECVDERASLSCIRYYLPASPLPALSSPSTPPSATPSPSAPPPPTHPFSPSEPQLRDVCDSHTDTGILTLILCSKVPGLQIWDAKNKHWLEVEKHLIGKYKSGSPRKHLVLCIVGEKIRTFTSSHALTPTLHRVMVEEGVERSSLLYFMDTAN